MKSSSLFLITLIAVLAGWMLLAGSCAQIGFPTGGTRDSLPPVLIKAVPPSGTTLFNSRKIKLYFDEYVDVQDLTKNLFISPAPSVNPLISANLRSITIDWKDSLLPNTTYTLQLGDAIRDINENNILRDFNYVFSTGAVIDSLTFSGKITLAATGGTDSTLLALLYRDLSDSAVRKKKPDFISRLSGSGTFLFQQLPAATFRLYALKDNDGGKTYSSPQELFAFVDSPVVVSAEPNSPVELFAFQQEAAAPAVTTLLKSAADKKLRYSSNLTGNFQSLIEPLTLSFNNSLGRVDLSALRLTDTNFNNVSCSPLLDSSRKKITVSSQWVAGANYRLIIPNDFAEDSIGNKLSRTDTLTLIIRPESFYGRVLFRFPTADSSRHPVVQLVQGEQLIYSAPLTGKTWKNDRVPPGEYSIRIIFDTNNNGRWDTGDFSRKIQPERALTLPQKLSVRGDWDNERDISY